MAVILPDIFGSMLKGERAAVEDNWTDLTNFENVEALRTQNDRDNLSLLGESYDFSGERAIAENVANQSMRDDTRDNYKVVGDIADQQATNVHSLLKSGITQDMAPQLNTMYSTVADAKVGRAISDAQIYAGQTGIQNTYAPQALGVLGAETQANLQSRNYQANNLFGNTVDDQLVRETGVDATVAGNSLARAQAESGQRVLPTAEQAQITGNRAVVATNENAIAAAPTARELQISANQAGTINNRNVIDTAPLTKEVTIAQLNSSLQTILDNQQETVENKKSAALATLSQNSQARAAAETQYQRALADGRTAEAQAHLQTINYIDQQQKNIEGRLAGMGVTIPPVATVAPTATTGAVSTVQNPMMGGATTTTPATTAAPNLATSAGLYTGPTLAPGAAVGGVQAPPAQVASNIEALYGPRPSGTGPQAAQEMQAYQNRKQAVDQSIQNAKNLIGTWTRPTVEPMRGPGDQARYQDDLNRARREEQAYQDAKNLLQNVGLLQ